MSYTPELSPDCLYEYYTALNGEPIRLTFMPDCFLPPAHVLIVPFWQGKLVFTRHKVRGIELPGGKMEPGETPLAAAVRETFEEIGASLRAISLIGQYIIGEGEAAIVKSIYRAEVERFLPVQFSSDTDGPIVVSEIPFQVKEREDFSPYMRDDVYPRLLEVLGLTKTWT
ncbi:MAG: NUDIX domain-containing protein [Candidatus Carbobacillus altaicus]|uniref:8-oxo-dGTPase n=1 Tax=Candidatus Carbonibacillus altaicus TaxID=2163959 RepID=A0A2R6Y5J5_9BACL|nr:NUDIX domain-containing protein [Candidatus Carbobacillus altaicus]PTQ57943.1 MAG: 8-oxo-dGTPase [Candidatus Carbobacillus altaicus]